MSEGSGTRGEEAPGRNGRNVARFFTENPHIAWMVLVGTLFWGWFSFRGMPQRKDPEIPVRVAVAICPWPGVAAERVEQLVTRKIERAMAANVSVDLITSTTRTGVAFVYVTLKDNIGETAKEFDDIRLKLEDVRDLPEGAGPIDFVKDFGTTSALMLTVASPPASDVEISLRARAIRSAIESARSARVASAGARASGVVTIVYWFPRSVRPSDVRLGLDAFVDRAAREGVLREVRTLEGAGFVCIDAVSDLDDAALFAYGDHFVSEHYRASELHPDSWPAILVRDPAETEERLAAVATDKYSYRELDDFTDLIKRHLHGVAEVSKIDRVGVLEERVFLNYSQARVAAYGLDGASLRSVLSARNSPLPGGVVEIGGRNVAIHPTGEFRKESDIGDVVVGSSRRGTPVYLRDLVEIQRAYESPPRYLNSYVWPDTSGRWHRSRAVTLAIQMRAGEQIAVFGEKVDRALGVIRERLPEDLVLARTSDQPLQVRENVDLFLKSLGEAILLVVLIALIGFWDWRSATLMALSIPLTLAMTFGFMGLLKIDIQQVSVASLIIALGLLVDDPVVAGDAVKRELADGKPRGIASWLGPTKMNKAVTYATITNIVAYLPLLLLPGDMGRFLWSLPVVITCSLVASRIVSTTFIPLLSRHLLVVPRKPEEPVARRREHGFGRAYYRLGRSVIRHRWRVLAGSFVFLALGGYFLVSLRTQFFPKDLSYLSYVDVWLPEDAPLSATRKAAARVEDVIRRVAEEHGEELARTGGGHGAGHGGVLRSLTTFVGGGGPRFWFSVSPEPRQENYAQIVLLVSDKHVTSHLVPKLQKALYTAVPEARISVRELETTAGGVPVSIRISGEDMPTLRAKAEELKALFRSIPIAERVQDDWGSASFVVNLNIDPDKANLAGITNHDVAWSSIAAMNGSRVGVLREADREIPVVARLREEERARLSDIQSLYVYSSQGARRVPLEQIASISHSLRPEKIVRRDQFRTIAVECFPAAGRLSSEVMKVALPRLRAFEASLPPGFEMEIGGEYEDQNEGFGDMAMVMLISIAAIFVALVVQFNNVVKPFLVFAAIPFGIVGALGFLWMMGAPFGFMAFLGVASLIGVIVSHVIVLFDFIEEAHERGEPLEEALLDAGLLRLRPVLITVGATVFGLVPLAMHGGPLWEPICYAQIGGLIVATFVTLLLVPVLYAIFVRDLRIVKWERPSV